MSGLKKLFILVLLSGFFSCETEQTIPKPPTYLRLELPDHTYTPLKDDCPFTFDIAKPYKYQIKELSDSTHKGIIDLGPLNGTVYLHYWKLKQPLSYYINNANDEVDRHKIKAAKITDENILRSGDRVFGTFFSLQGDVATPFQFYLTDSTDQFMYAEVLFNSSPNYDSLKPSLDYLKIDLDKMLETFKWKQR